MKILFYLGVSFSYPVGGHKIIYEYANRLSDKGFDVTILYDYSLKYRKYKKYMPEVLHRLLVSLLSYRELIFHNRQKWFSLSPNISQLYEYVTRNNSLNEYDVIVATAYITSGKVASLCNKKKLYFIQDFENWGGCTNDEVISSYRLGMKNIVICKWLKKIVDDAVGNNSCILIPNGIDFQVFGIDVPINKRNPYSISMLYHSAEHKGSKYGIEVLKILKNMYPDLVVYLFGVPNRPEDLPKWISYTQHANQKQLREIYNNTAMFLCPTINEGFGLTGAESMACGCAMVSTDYGGVHEYTTPGEDVILSPAKDVDAMVANFVYLIDNQDERIRLAMNGNKNIKKLDWNISVNLFETAINSL